VGNTEGKWEAGHTAVCKKKILLTAQKAIWVKKRDKEGILAALQGHF